MSELEEVKTRMKEQPPEDAEEEKLIQVITVNTC